ncbi:MAG TPA: hypothetical protein VGG99_17355, partial [Acetobacteraceae bacterium]
MPQELQGRAGWTGAELERTGDWIRVLNATQVADIADAVGHVRNRPLYSFRRDDFPLPHTAPLLAEISDELENGRGAVRLRSLDVSHFTLDELRQAFWGIGCHLGTPVFQNAKAETMGEVRDESRQRWPAKFGQLDKWSFCLRAASMPRNRRDNDQTIPPDPGSGIQGQGGV